MATYAEIQKYLDTGKTVNDTGAGILEYIENPLGTIASTVASTLTYAAEGVGSYFEGGVDAVGYGVAGIVDSFGMEDLSNTITKQFNENTVADAFSGLQNNLDSTTFNWAQSDSSYADLAQGVGYVGGTLLASYFLPNKGILQLGKLGVPVTSVISGTGTAMSSAYQSGATDEEAWGYGLLSGGTTGLLEGISGGIGGLGSGAIDDIVVGSLRKKITGTATGRVAEIATKAAFEGGEEAIETLLDPLWQSMTFNEKAEFLGNWDEVGEAAIIGALTSAIVQIPSGITGTEWEAKQAEIVAKAKVDALKVLRVEAASNANPYAGKTDYSKTMTTKPTEANQIVAQQGVTNPTNIITSKIGANSIEESVANIEAMDLKEITKDFKGKINYALADPTKNIDDSFSSETGSNYVKNITTRLLQEGKKEKYIFLEQELAEIKELTDKYDLKLDSNESTVVGKLLTKEMTMEEAANQDVNMDAVKEIYTFLENKFKNIRELNNKVKAQQYPVAFSKFTDLEADFRKAQQELSDFDETVKSLDEEGNLTADEKAAFEKERKGLSKTKDKLLKAINKHNKNYGFILERADYIPYLMTKEDAKKFKKEGAGMASEFSARNKQKIAATQSKTGKETSYDVITSYLNYIDSISNNMYINPAIDNYRALAAKFKSSDNAKEVQFGEFLETKANELANNKSEIDAVLDKSLKKVGDLYLTASNNIKKGMVAGNAQTVLVQASNLGNVVGQLGSPKYIVKGIKLSKSNPNLIKESIFLTERQFDLFSGFDSGLMNNVDKIATKGLEFFDMKVANIGWYSFYAKAVDQNIADPVQYADEQTRNAIGGRGTGERSTFQESKYLTSLEPFSLEMINTLQNFGQLIKNKKVLGIIMFAAMNYMADKVFEEIGITTELFDPLAALEDAFNSDNPAEAVGRIAGEVISNVYLGEMIAEIYPEYGTEILPTRSEFFGEGDPTKYGTGGIIGSATRKVLSGDVTDTITGIGLFAGITGSSQFGKTANALETILGDGVVRNSSGNVQYVIDKNPINIAKGMILGNFEEKQAYYDDGTTPISENQEQEIKEMMEEDGITFEEGFAIMQAEREVNALKTDVYDAIENGQDASKYIDELNNIEDGLGDLYAEQKYLSTIPTDKDSGEISGTKKETIYDSVINSDLSDENKIAALANAGYDKDLEGLMIAGITLDNWLVFQRDIAKLTADDDPNSDVEGQSLSGSYKEKVISVIESMDATTLEKNMLYASQDYALSSAQKDLIYNNVNSLDISNEAKLEIIKEFGGFTILENGNLKGW